MNRLYWVRHGENPANLTGEFSSYAVDYGLTFKGRVQARQTAAYFQNKPIRAIYSSPLKRARETAEIIAEQLNLPVTVLEGLRELNVGDLEKEPPSKFSWTWHNQVLMAWANGNPSISFPKGEDYRTLRNRMGEAMAIMFTGRHEESIIAVSHGGNFIMTIRDLCPQLEPEKLWQTHNPNCGVTEVVVERQDGRLSGEVLRWGDIGHLSGIALEPSPMPKVILLAENESHWVLTSRMHLVPLNLEQLQDISNNRERLVEELGCQVFPEAISEAALRAVAIKIERMRYVPQGRHIWFTYWLLVLNEGNLGIGLAGFKGAPNVQGEVEIGYGIAPQYQDQGLMTEAVTGLLSWACQQVGCRAVTAETLKTNPASQRVLEKNGFQQTGDSDTAFYWSFACKKDDK